MCGLAGVFRPTGTTPTDLELIKRMNSIQKHRGPDDVGIDANACCILGHRRLAIIDLSPDGHQPFFSDDGRYRLIFNGEIYNYIELRSELIKLGWHFKTRTDTEVLLKMYLQYGNACLSKLNGMFAFVVYDSFQHTLFLARDRVGIKPLYYTIQKSTLYFASEIKALSVIPRLNKAVNYQSVFDYFVFNRTDVYDETFLKAIKRIPKGSYATFDTKGLQISKWWCPEDFINTLHEKDNKALLPTIRELLISAVKLRMRSDVPVGSCLSGGLDSSILIGILYSENHAQAHYPTFTASFKNHPLDETGYIDLLNIRYPFKNIRTYPDAGTLFDELTHFIYMNDEPTTNPSFYSQYRVMQAAKEYGVTVLLDGQGGDENFAGYQYLHGFNLYGLLKEKKYHRFGSELIKNVLRKQDQSVYQTFIFQLLSNSNKKRLLKKTVPYLRHDFFSEYVETSLIYNEFFDIDNLNKSIVRHFQYKLEHLLRTEDRNSMAFSIEARVPYLDYRLIEYMLGVSGKMKIQNGETKYLQKMALGTYTIPEILNRTDKIGFGTPGNEWMKMPQWQKLTHESHHELTAMFPDIFRKNYYLPEKSFNRWQINQLALWTDIFR